MIFIVRNKVIIKVRYTEGNLDVSCGDGSECGNAVRDARRARLQKRFVKNFVHIVAEF